MLPSAASRRALLSLTAPSALQLAPPFVEYHQLPLVVSAAVTAIPSSAPVSGSVTLSSCPAGEAGSTSEETSVPTAPDGAPASSLIAVSAGLFVLSSTGAVWISAS